METTKNQTDQLANLLKDHFGESCNKNQPQLYFDYDDKLSDDQITALFDGTENAENGIYDEVFENNIDYICDVERQAVKEFISDNIEFFEGLYADDIENELDFDDDISDQAFDDHYETIREFICVDYDIKTLINNSSACFNVVVNDLEHNFSGWGFNYYNISYDDCKGELDFWFVNPRQIARFFGKNDLENWPDYKYREGLENINPKDLYESWLNHTTEYAKTVFTVSIDLADYIENPAKYKNIKIAAGSYYWTHDNMNGACGTEERTSRDILLREGTFSIEIDGQNGYGLDDICGLCKSSVWDTEIIPFKV